MSNLSECPAVCGGTGEFLGALGMLAHFRCQDCGIGYSEEIDSTYFLDDDNFEEQYDA